MRRNVIPLSLQTLVENAIKHNEISKASPLKIMIAVTDDHTLIVEDEPLAAAQLAAHLMSPLLRHNWQPT